MSIQDDFYKIEKYAHVCNWLYDWILVRKVYLSNEDTYSILTPFAYSYLEEVIRSTTSKYGIQIYKNDGSKKYSVGKSLLKLAKNENGDDNEFCDLLDRIEHYFNNSSAFDRGNNRNSVAHGYMHSVYWTKESFEKLIHDIAQLSPFTKF